MSLNLLEDCNDNQVDLLNLQNDTYTIPNIDFYGAIVVNEFMNDRLVDIRDGEIVQEGYLSKYKLYKVRTRKINQEFDTEVFRRFSDFEWLYQELINKYGGFIIPSIPDKHLLTKLNMESYEFADKRRNELQLFVQRIFQHPQLRYVPELRIFIEDQEKFISIYKGELEYNKTFEQKYENLVSSVKGFFVQSDKQVTKVSEDKDISPDEQILINLSMKGQRMQKILEEHINTLKEECKVLNFQNEALLQWNGLGNAKQEDLRQNHVLKSINEDRQKKINTMVIEIDRNLLQKLNTILQEIEWALQACKRRRTLQQQLNLDQQRIEELKLKYTDNNSRRDIEMDVLKTKFQKNKDRATKMNLIMAEEIMNFVKLTKNQIGLFMDSFKQLFKQFSQRQQN
ncbi:hypothetical protein pb186bvf_014057 [Paramecium bursaria]